MRLFIAVNFTEKIKDQLSAEIIRLKGHAVQGNFTRRENLHLTLVFIGETGRVSEAEHAMDAVVIKPFTLNMGGLGVFRRAGGDICWIGIEKNDILSSVYRQLYAELSKAGFQLERRAYQPHLTLGREVILQEGYECSTLEKMAPKMSMEVKKISLMKSERISGKLTYTEIYSKMI